MAGRNNHSVRHIEHNPERANTPPAALLSRLINTKVYPAGHLHNKPHPQEHCESRADSQVKAHPLRVIDTKRRRVILLCPPCRASSLNATTCTSSCPRSSTTPSISTRARKPSRRDDTIHSFGSFNQSLSPVPPVLRPLPHRICPEIQNLSSMSSPEISSLVSFPTIEKHDKDVSVAAIEAPLKMPATKKVVRKASRNQGTDRRNSTKPHEFPPSSVAITRYEGLTDTTSS
ncbi:hypothetical protein F5Y03DRAFT_371950 [Xylaria venustula]|nr:hypothetical protein F5Y03DRAFT_371950 [Xylaria venustula]